MEWDIPRDTPISLPGNTVYAGWIDDSIVGSGTRTYSINGVDVQIPYNLVIYGIQLNESSTEPTFYLFGTDDHGLDGVVKLSYQTGDPYYVSHITLEGHSKQPEGTQDVINQPATITIGKLPSVITDQFTEADVDYFGYFFGDSLLTIHSCAKYLNPPA